MDTGHKFSLPVLYPLELCLTPRAQLIIDSVLDNYGTVSKSTGIKKEVWV